MQRSHCGGDVLRYIVQDLYYDPPEEIVFKNKNDLIDYLVERIGDLNVVIER